jgi:single-strand DNA-binding protein
MYLNRAIILGNLTRDPELRYLPASGTPVASFSVATNRAWTDETGTRQESAEFHQVIVYGAQAEPSAAHLRRGQLVLVEGRLQTRSWDGQDGQKRYRTEIIAERVQFGPKRLDAAPANDAAEENVPLDGNDVVPF